jgi:DNA polymerase
LIDFETASSCDLKRAGAWRYAQDPTTEILCLGYTFGDDEDVLSADVLWPRTAPRLLDAVLDPQCMFVAHNAAFEKAIWRELMMGVYGWPDIPDHRWHDSMAVCAMKALPLRLDRAASALGLRERKDAEGSRVTLSLSRPNKAGHFDRSEEKLQRVYTYNAQDLRAELELHRRIRGLGAEERQVWLLDQQINQRGIRLDITLIDKMQSIVHQAEQPLIQEFVELTGVKPGQNAKVMEWLRANGCEIPNLQKETISRYLGESDAEEEIYDDEEAETEAGIGEETGTGVCDTEGVKRALHVRQILGSASVKKLGAMRSCVCGDGRARGLLQYHGAGPGRWAGRLLQPQNFARPTLKVDGEPPDQNTVIDALMTGDAEYVRMMFGEPIKCVSSALRHAIIAADDTNFAVGDFATIEARIVLALAGQLDKVALIASGTDVYIDMAQQIYKCPVDKHRDPEKRQTGKNSVLGCGFQMGWKKFKARYCQTATDEFAQDVIRVYRTEWAPEVVKLWRGLEDAATNTVWTGRPHEAYGVTYALEDGWLTARLPSGRKLWYYDPRPVRKAMPWDHTDVRPGFEYSAQKMGRWQRISAYGGLLTENVVQALARDLLVFAMFNCEANDYPIVLTVHDEIVSERPGASKVVLDNLMAERPQWARALQIPVKADCWDGDRYRK